MESKWRQNVANLGLDDIYGNRVRLCARMDEWLPFRVYLTDLHWNDDLLYAVNMFTFEQMGLDAAVLLIDKRAERFPYGHAVEADH